MARAKVLVYTRPLSLDQIEKFETWYDTVHIPEVLDKVTGVQSAARFVSSGGGDYVSLAVYDIEAVDPSQVLSTMFSYAASGHFRMDPSLSSDQKAILLLEPGM